MKSRDLANAIRFLAIDAIERAKSGHPGAPMGMADIAEVLWRDFLVHNPADPLWPNRDRVILSNGHASMLLYAVLHLSGYDISLEDIKNFRQLSSKTPGHPEYGETPGVETTTGPLGQGIATGVGMALAEKIMGNTFNRQGFNIVDHYTFVLLGDGCLMEGISHEACSLAGTWGLGKLIVLYDDNGITIDGSTKGWFTEDIRKRFEGYGWQVISSVDGHNREDIHRAIKDAMADKVRPSLICFKTTIGFGSPNLAGSEKTHGSPLGEGEVEATREALGWKYPPFEIPKEIYDAWDAREKGASVQQRWDSLFAQYKKAYPELAREFLRRVHGDLPSCLEKEFINQLEVFIKEEKEMATRSASGNCIASLAPLIPELIGGSADLTGSNKTKWPGARVYTREEGRGSYLHYGVREFAMAAIMNGLALYGGFIPYGGTFLVFSDYARNAIRLSSLMKLRVIYVFTHDSIGVGEDGPTHQPIEHLSSLRLIPGVNVWRPCDLVETFVAWKSALERKHGPTILILSRQKLKKLVKDASVVAGIERGGYVLLEEPHSLERGVLLMGTGSEVQLCMDVANILAQGGIPCRVVSIPCMEIFDAQPLEYKSAVIPSQVALKVAVEAGSPHLWYRYVGEKGLVIGLEEFGKSAPGDVLFKYYGFTPESIVDKIKSVLNTNRS